MSIVAFLLQGRFRSMIEDQIMKQYGQTTLFFITALLVAGIHPAADAVDPNNSAEWQAMELHESPALKRWLPARIKQLEHERVELLAEIEKLPQHAPAPLSDHMGFHSVPMDAGSRNVDSASQINILFAFDPGLAAVALVPAFVPGRPGSYAFPKRFKIEILSRGAGWVGGESSKGGKWFIPPPPYEWEEVVSCLDEDFPDPGPYPVFFHVEDKQFHRMRITLLSAGTDDSYQALGELYLFRDPEKSDRIGDNMMAWHDVVLSASNSLAKPPLWHETYLNDGIVGLGMPLSEKVSEVEDFTVLWEHGETVSEPVQIVLDLGQVRQVGRVQLCPADAPQGMAIPRFGFPGQVFVEVAKNSDFSDAERFESVNIHERLHADSFLNITTGAKKVRYIRITLKEFDTYKGKQILSLGEIRVSEYDEVWSQNCRISATGLPPSAMDQLPRLVDGFSRKRSILREADWIRGLALRRPLDQRLVFVEQALQLTRDKWNSLKLRAAIWGGSLFCVALLGAMGLQRLQRRKVLKRLRYRITRDLHDEVGSSLGGITLAARRMEQAGATEDELSELSLMAREASAALRDVVWVIDQTKIRLPDLLSKLCERAERVLRGFELKVDLPDECPNLEVPLPFKRHLLMLFKEAVHNCARHSGATDVQIRISVRNETLSLSLMDNGCGFDPDAQREGWGVDSMRKRAEELGGKMELQTAPGKGTTIQLTVPLSTLQIKTDHSYKTSN